VRGGEGGGKKGRREEGRGEGFKKKNGTVQFAAGGKRGLLSTVVATTGRGSRTRKSEIRRPQKVASARRKEPRSRRSEGKNKSFSGGKAMLSLLSSKREGALFSQTLFSRRKKGFPSSLPGGRAFVGHQRDGIDTANRHSRIGGQPDSRLKREKGRGKFVNAEISNKKERKRETLYVIFLNARTCRGRKKRWCKRTANEKEGGRRMTVVSQGKEKKKVNTSLKEEGDRVKKGQAEGDAGHGQTHSKRIF